MWNIAINDEKNDQESPEKNAKSLLKLDWNEIKVIEINDELGNAGTNLIATSSIELSWLALFVCLFACFFWFLAGPRILATGFSSPAFGAGWATDAKPTSPYG